MASAHQPGPAPGFGIFAALRGDDVDTTERLSADDMATLREGQFLAVAIAQARAPQAPAQPLGVCLYCREACLPHAAFCDALCQADHEDEQAVLRRQGRAR